jgi:hypothetical protein
MFNLSFLKGQEEVDGSLWKQKVISQNALQFFLAFCAKLKITKTMISIMVYQGI